MKTLRIKDKSTEVLILRYLLNVGISNISDTFDSNLETSVKGFQESNNLTVDGIVGPKTWDAILSKLPTVSKSKNNKSRYAYAIQLILGTVNVDGIFGSKTAKAVMAYQSAANLSADGIVGQKTWAKMLSDPIEDPTVFDTVINDCVHYLQWDSRWKNIKYSTHTSSQTIGNSGCGPTSMAQILATWIDQSITPVETCKLAVANGFRTYDSGTSRNFMKWCFEHYEGFSKFVRTSSVTTLIAAIREGALAVCSMNKGANNFWTKGGHFITVIGVDNTYIYANDPNKSSAPRKQKITDFKKCMNEAMIFWSTIKENLPKKEETTTTVEPPLIVREVEPVIPEVNEPVDHPDLLVGVNVPEPELLAIPDIAKYQGTIDFNKLKDLVNFVICKATGKVLDAKFHHNATEMLKYAIPFGVYHYSYASTYEESAEHADWIFKEAEGYHPNFYVLDVEESANNQKVILGFVDRLRALGVKKIGLYVGQGNYKKWDVNSIKDKVDFIWIPRYGKNDGEIPEEKYHPIYDCDLWQYTSVGKLEGISGNVDLSVPMNTRHSLRWYMGEE